jgi:hypothetical protein
MKLAGDASCVPNLQHQLPYTFRYLVGQAFTQVEAHITNEGSNQANVPALMTVLETAFGDSYYVVTVE